MAQVLTDRALAPADGALAVLTLTWKLLPACTFFGVLIESVSFGRFAANVAVTDRDSLIITSQLPVPEHPAPDQPVNVDPEATVAVRLTLVPRLKVARQDEPQSMPEGEEVTPPLPSPASWTASG